MSEESKVEGTETQVQAPEDDGFGAAFDDFVKEDGDQGQDPPLETKDEPGTKADEAPNAEAPATEPPASQEKPDDLWANAPPEVREAHERELAEIRTRAEAAETLVKRHSGRLTQLHRERDSLQARINEGTKAPPKEGGESDEDYRKRMTEEFPDFAPMFDRLDAANAQIESLKTTQTNLASAQTEDMLQQQLSILEQAHPTYREDVKDPAFVEWATGLPEYMQAAIRANAKEIVDGASAADILTRYKAAKAPAEDPAKKQEEERRKEQLEASRKVETRPAAVRSAASDGTYEQEFDRFVREDRRIAAR